MSKKRYQFKTRQKINRKYKDRLFRFVFHDKKDLLELYNAINGSDYKDTKELEINTLENVLYLGMKNDLSFLLCSSMNLYEHQSTWNENMPLRGLFYFADLYQRYLQKNGYRLTGLGKRLPLPFPRYVVFYNGTKEEPDRMQLLLSDSFFKQDGEELPSLECRALVLNINYGHNQALMERCGRLRDYAAFIEEIRHNLKRGLLLEDAVDRAIDTCIEQGILADILSKSKMEVRKMLLTEYDERAEREYLRKEAIELGLEEGREKGLKEGLKEGRKEGLKEGRREGIRQGEERITLLMQRLLESNRMDDMRKALEDREYQKKLLKEFDIS